MKMKVTRPFLLGGERQEIDTVIDIDDRSLAAMLRHEGKAVAVDPIPPPSQMTTETAPGFVSGKSERKKAEAP